MSSASSLKTQENSNLVPPCWSGEGAGEETNKKERVDGNETTQPRLLLNPQLLPSLFLISMYSVIKLINLVLRLLLIIVFFRPH